MAVQCCWVVTPRATPFVLQQPFGAHSDAKGLGQIGRRVILGRVITAHTHLPARFVCMAQEAEGESAIYLFGICAAILTARVASAIPLAVTRP